MLKKGVILLSIVFMIARQCHGQGLEVEILIRPVVTSLRGNEVVKTNYDPTVRFSVGVGLNYYYTAQSAISLTILYDRKGAKGESTIILRDDQNQVIGQGTLSQEFYFDYLTIPIQWRHRFGNKIKFEAGGGIYTGVLLASELRLKGFGLNSNSDVSEDVKMMDFGLTVSFGTVIPFNDNLTLRIGLNDNLGIVNVSKFPVANDGTIKHNSIGLAVGLSLRLN